MNSVLQIFPTFNLDYNLQFIKVAIPTKWINCEKYLWAMKRKQTKANIVVSKKVWKMMVTS